MILFLKVIRVYVKQKCFTVLIHRKISLQQNRIKNLFQERLNYFFVEKGNVNYSGSRILEREFKGDSSISLHEFFKILIVSHDAENAQKCNKEIKHIKVQCKGG